MAEPAVGGAAVLGDANIVVGVDLSQIPAKFAEAKAMRDAFLAEMAGNSDGLLKFTQAANDGAAATGKQATASTASAGAAETQAAAIDKVTAAEVASTEASKARTSALESEADAQARISAMIEKSIADMEAAKVAQSSLTDATAGGVGAGVANDLSRGSSQKLSIPAAYLSGTSDDTGFKTSGPPVVDQSKTVQSAKDAKQALLDEAAASDQLVQRSNTLLSSVDKNYASQLKWNKAMDEAKALFAAGAISEAEFATASKAIEEGLAGVTEGAHVSSVAIRETVTGIREIGRGDFSRLAGSASILGQSLGLITAATLPFLIGLAAVAGAVALVTTAMVKGEEENSKFANTLTLTGNYAGLTANEYEAMAERIAKANDTTIGSSKAQIQELTANNNLTAAEIEKLIDAADNYARATGQSADDVLKQWTKMSEGPTKFAEDFARTNTNVISPTQIAIIRDLEARGEKEQAIAQLIDDLQNGVAKNTQDNAGIIISTWRGVVNTVSALWNSLKNIGQAAPLESQLDGVNKQIGILQRELSTIPTTNQRATQSIQSQITALEGQRAALSTTLETQNKAAQAQSDATAKTQLQEAAIEKTNDTYLKGVDSTARYHDAVAALNNTLADGLKMSRDTPIGTLLDAAAKSGISSMQQLGATYSQQVDKIKKENLPDTYKADAKALSEAEAAAKKAAAAAAELAKQRANEMDTLQGENAVLTQVLPLYKDQALSLTEIAAKEEGVRILQRLKLDANSAEGKSILALLAANAGLKDSIDAETHSRQILAGIQEKDDQLKAEIETVGLAGGAYAAAKVKIDAYATAKKDHVPISAAFIKTLDAEAAAIQKDTDALANAKFLDKMNTDFKTLTSQMEVQAKTMDMGREAAAEYQKQQELVNQANEEHITLTPDLVASINAEAAAYGKQVDALGKLTDKQTAEKFAQDQLEDSLTGILSGTESLTKGFEDLAQALLKAALQAALFGNGPLAGLLGGSNASVGGTGGGLLGGIFGGSGGGGGGLGGLLGGIGKLFGPSLSGGFDAGSITSGLGSNFTGSLVGGGVSSFDFSSSLADFLHDGTDYARAGGGASRAVPSNVFLNAPRFHQGLQPDEFPAILQTGEKVIPRGGDKNKNSRAPNVTIAVYPKDYDSFRASQKQVARKTKEMLR